MRPNRTFVWILLLAAIFSLVSPGKLYAGAGADFNDLSRGFFRILTAPFQIPRHLIHKTLSEPIGLGTIDGALTGAYYAVREVSGGVLDILRGAAPYAKYLIFFL